MEPEDDWVEPSDDEYISEEDVDDVTKKIVVRGTSLITNIVYWCDLFGLALLIFPDSFVCLFPTCINHF
jgi:hypothetical protein